MSDSKKIIHAGDYGQQPTDIGIYSRNLPTWCSEDSSNPDLSRVKKSTISYQTILPVVSGCNVLTVTTFDLMILSAIGKGVEAGYAKEQKGSSPDNGWVN